MEARDLALGRQRRWAGKDEEEIMTYLHTVCSAALHIGLNDGTR